MGSDGANETANEDGKMTTTKELGPYEITAKEAVAELEECGCERLKKEDWEGRTRSGWWCDTVWLAPFSQPNRALAILKGGS